MILLFIICAFLSVFAGAVFYTVTQDAVMLFAPTVINFAVFGILAAAYKLFAKENNEEDYSSYHSAHSL